ncbi:ExbD/TolR family protein [Ferruginibacter yonginensis]|uniref:ExbD/TolR family protein n=1 Tax=Ferruginibacter yonginensis TaxID=1310416 RepID=A0ABV8QRS7_9BACT
MAENISSERKQPNKKFHKKATRVDLTPMVDLGFLLITFFVFTTSMAQPKAMDMVSPNDTVIDVNDLICESCAITIIPTANNVVYYYEGNFATAVIKRTDYSATGIRALLSNKMKAANSIKREPILIIKPTTTASFKNLIDIIDEHTICLYKRYYLDTLNAAELATINHL